MKLRKESKAVVFARAHRHRSKFASVKKLAPAPAPQAVSARQQIYANPTAAEAAAKADETLAPGDIVIGHEGPLVYKGDGARASSDGFVPANDRRVAASLRKKLSAYVNMGDVGSLNEAFHKSKPKQRSTAMAGKEPPRTALEAIARYVDGADGRRIRFVGGSWSGRRISEAKMHSEITTR